MIARRMTAHLILFIALSAAALTALALTENAKQALVERIDPLGTVCLPGNERCSSNDAVASTGGAARSGDVVYADACVACHDLGVAGAPKVGDAPAWTGRISKGTDTLYDHAINGFNAMPARGACASCSDDEIKAAVDYMVQQSK